MADLIGPTVQVENLGKERGGAKVQTQGPSKCTLIMRMRVTADSLLSAFHVAKLMFTFTSPAAL